MIYKHEGFTYYCWEGTAGITIKRFEGKIPEGDFTFPDELGGEMVFAIGERLFRESYGIRSVTLPKGTKDIRAYAFYGCGQLEAVEIPGGATFIGESAFEKCYELTDVVIPKRVRSICDCTFADCHALDFLAIPKAVVGIGYAAFYNCHSLEHLTLPEGVEYIADHPFFGCGRLQRVTVTQDSYAERYMQKRYPHILLESIPTTEKNPISFQYTVENGCATIIGYEGQRSTGRVRLPETLGGCPVTAIGAEAFRGCAWMSFIWIPESITSIGDGAFQDCAALKAAYMQPGSSITRISAGLFRNCGRLEMVNLPVGIASIGDYAFYGCARLRRIEFSRSLREIGAGAFTGCREVFSLHIYPEVERIGELAFDDCGKTTLFVQQGSYGEQCVKEHAWKYYVVSEFK